MAVTIDVENFPPDAAPQAISLNATTSWQTLIEPPNYNAPDAGSQLGGVNVIVDGVAEIISALMLTNKSGTARNVSVRITRANSDVAVILQQMDVEPNDVLLVPLNGQVLLNDSGTTNGTGDKLEITAEANSAIDATISWTQGRAEATDGA